MHSLNHLGDGRFIILYYVPMVMQDPHIIWEWDLVRVDMISSVRIPFMITPSS